MKKFIKKFVNILFWVICTVALTIFVNTGIQRYYGVQQPMIFGFGFAIVETGSMEPNIPTGSLIIVQEQDKYEVDDVVTYIDYRDLSITHRIVDIKDGTVVTKGDANTLADPEFDDDAIIGKVVAHVPKVGDIIKPLTTTGVIIVLVCLLVLSCVWDFVLEAIRKKKNKECENSQESVQVDASCDDSPNEEQPNTHSESSEEN